MEYFDIRDKRPESEDFCLFYDGEFNLLGAGQWKGFHIISFPDTCGCNGICTGEAWYWMPIKFNLMGRGESGR